MRTSQITTFVHLDRALFFDNTILNKSNYLEYKVVFFDCFNNTTVNRKIELTKNRLFFDNTTLNTANFFITSP